MQTKLRSNRLTAIWLATALSSAACSSPTPTTPGGQMSGGGGSTASTPASATARYRVTFDSTWTRVSHPTDFPSDAHFSRLVGATHGGSVRFWSEGALASQGIKDMAERGRTTPLDQEVNAAIAAGSAEHLLIGGAIDNSPGSVTLEFEVSQAYPLVTLVSMVAPSPDWFVGVSSLPLLQDGQWVARQQIDLVPWDAGTDSGATFTAPDLVTSPPQGVSQIRTPPLSPAGRVTRLGTFTFTRVPG